jgi:hypothetical protein
MFPSFYEEEVVRIDGENSVRLAINFRALSAIEGLAETSMDHVLTLVLSGGAPLSLVGKVLWGLMREHHPESTLDDAAGLLFDKNTNTLVGLAMNALLMRAFHIEPEAKDKNPPKRRGASKASSKRGSKPEPVA